ncbi:MAG: hypothetical protein FIB08_05655 [Candidatus Methanoperedens sp.]|nr:hypothetical protein [Candidatus Methanoperedens sp.]
MDRELNILLVSTSVIISFIGLFFVIKICAVWTSVDKGVLKARVFLSSNFLMKNWIYVFLAGAFIAMRRMIQLLDLLEFPVKSRGMDYLFDLMGLIVISLLVMLAFQWYRLVYSTFPDGGRSMKAAAPAIKP